MGLNFVHDGNNWKYSVYRPWNNFSHNYLSIFSIKIRTILNYLFIGPSFQRTVKVKIKTDPKLSVLLKKINGEH